MRLITAGVLAVLGMLSPASAAADARCLPPEAPRQIKIADASGKLVGNVLCCCATHNGGSCCKYVAFCGGFIPGCLCSGVRPDHSEHERSN